MSYIPVITIKIKFHCSTAHKNIIDAINSARLSAEQSQEAVIKSEMELYETPGYSVIDRGMQSLQKSHQIVEKARHEINNLEGNFIKL